MHNNISAATPNKRRVKIIPKALIEMTPFELQEHASVIRRQINLAKQKFEFFYFEELKQELKEIAQLLNKHANCQQNAIKNN